MFDAKGAKAGEMALPADVFGLSYNKQLIAQAIRVYLTNQREGSAHTKTRGMVEGSTRKLYKQKGTGRARHGGIRAPIFVGGGVALGPQAHEIRRDMPQKMRQLALFVALSHTVKNNVLKVVDGADTLPLKTKSFAGLFTAMGVDSKTLFIYGKETVKIKRAVKNIGFVTVLPYSAVNTYEVMTHKNIVMTKDAVEAFGKK